MKRKIFSVLKWTILYIAITFALVEGVLWILGYRPYHNEDYSVVANPSNPFIADKNLGIQLNPGSYDFVLNNAVKFHATHLDNGERKVPGIPAEDTAAVIFLGCSFTYGYGVNDSESYPAIAQLRHPEWHVENTAVVGYGTAQHLLQLRRLLKTKSPKCVVLGFSSVHFIRTVLAEEYRANLKIGYRRSSSDVDDRMSGARFPYIEDCSKRIRHATWDDLYHELPGRYWSATMNFTQGVIEKARDTDADQVAVTACLIREMYELCEANNVSFGIVCLDATNDTKKLHKQLKEVPWKNVYFSFQDKKYTHLPYDSHPNVKGHQKIADSVVPFIQSLINHD